jgi:hypothetical protein
MPKTWIESKREALGRRGQRAGEPVASFEPNAMMRFLTTARLDLIAGREWSGSQWLPADTPLTRDKMADHISFVNDGAALSNWLAGKKWTRTKLLEFENDLMVFACHEHGASPDAFHTFGWLTSYWQELGAPGWTPSALNERHRAEPHESYQLARWHRELSKSGPNNSAEALVLGQALLGLLAGANSPAAANVILCGAVGPGHQLRPDVDRTLRALITVSCRRPTGGALPAIHMAAMFGTYIIPIVEEHLRFSPVGFRTMRILTRILTTATTRHAPDWWSKNGTIERDLTWKTMTRLAREELPDPYPARSFFVEALREVVDRNHKGFPQPMIDEAYLLLDKRLHDEARSTRERLYAATVLHGHDHAAVLRFISTATQPAFEFLGRLLRHQETTGDSIETILLSENGPPTLPEIALIDRAIVTPTRGQGVTYVETLPIAIQKAATRYLRYALLSPEGTYRRQAGELLREAGIAYEVSQMITEGVLQQAVGPELAWVRENAAFLLGNIRADEQTDVLFDLAQSHGTRDDVAVAHAALFAIGDAGHREEDVLDRLIALIGNPETPDEVRRAATYSLATLRPESHLDEPSPEQQLKALEQISDRDSDRLTRALGCWGAENIKRWIAFSKAAEETELWGLLKLTAVTPGCY